MFCVMVVILVCLGSISVLVQELDNVDVSKGKLEKIEVIVCKMVESLQEVFVVIILIGVVELELKGISVLIEV